MAKALECVVFVAVTMTVAYQAGAQTPVFVAGPAGTVSDPTIRPFQAPGIPATLSTTLEIDFQVNGRPDLLACHVANPPNPKVNVPCRVLRPQPDGSVTDVTRQMFGTGALPSMENPREIVIGDFNHDGRPDIFIGAHGYDASPFNGETNVLLISNPDRTYTDRSSTLPQVPDFSHSACVGDVNGDGNLDIYVGNVFGSGRIGPYFLMGKGDGTFTQRTSGLPAQIQSLQEKFLTCLLVDVDQDGFPDLVLGTHGDNGYVDNIVLFNDGTGDFTRRPRYVLPIGPLGTANMLMLDIVSFDINRDGRPDLMLLSSNRTTASGFGLQVLINRGDLTLADETAARLGTSASRTTGSYCGFLRLADFNGDGWEDVYCSDGPADIAPRYWMTNGDGTWTPPAPGVLSPGSGFGIHAVDFDGDGRPDLLQVAHTDTGDVTYKSFLNRTPRTVPSEPIIGAVIAGNGQVSIFFTAPLGSGTSPITGYTATCSPGTVTGVVTRTGTGSPITVPGLTNGRRYSCSVTATNLAGISLASGTVSVTPTGVTVGVSVAAIVPTSGSTAGGSAVTITGANFVSGAIVTIGGVAATNVTVENATAITATTAAHAAGLVNVVVTNPDTQTDTLVNGFRYTCTYSVAPLSKSFTAPADTGTIAVTAGAECPWTAASNATWLTISSGSSGTGSGTVAYAVAANTSGSSRAGALTIAGQTVTVTQSAVSVSTMSLDKTLLVFSGVNTGAALSAQTSAQTIRLTQTGAGPVTWTATSDKPWLTVTPASGSGSAALSIAVKFDGSVAAAGYANGTIALALTGAANTVGPINVTFTIVSSTAPVSPPFGVVDTPVGDASVLAGSIAVTGWTLDNIGVQRVELWRDLQPGETTPPFASTPSDPRHGKVFIANATFVDGARPDVEALNRAATPFAYRAGWGYLLLTWGMWNQGNGTYKLYAFAFDQENNLGTIGTKTVIISNNTATKPFGSIDTPGIGGDASGPNFGWGLTPKVNGVATCKIQPSGVQVSIDSGPLQPVVYGDARTDIAGAFPGFSNTADAGGHFIIDWSTLTTGAHTIGWLITDDCGRADGVGSRFFNVAAGTSLTASMAPAAGALVGPETESRDAITVARGYGELPEIVTADEAGSRTIEIKQGGRIEIRLPRGYEAAYQLVGGGQRRPLPTGATWDAPSGTFYWQPAPGFLGRYRIVFTNGSEHISVRVVVTP